ncbi:HAD family hydrolase [Treponema socranskii]|uniref:HAD family hydrolase n=1 Tax=Treponema socranskii TaxID=53419 RepID=UPI003D90F037
MFTANMGDIRAVAFDIDGTLYKPRDLHARMMFHFFRFNQFFLHYGIVRSKIHDMGVLDDFYATQAEMLAKRIGCGIDAAKERLERIVYKGLSPFFESVPLCAHVEEAFQAFHDAGLKIALMSDFPPEQKGNLWGLRKYCDVLLGTETTGALKPSTHPFRVLAEKLGTAPEHILYVGNSVKYDVIGAKNAGMKAAHFEPLWRNFFRMSSRKADISFYDYRQLHKIVLQ